MKKTFLLLLGITLITIAYAQNKTNIPDGYGNLKWGTVLSNAKTNITGKIVYTDEKKVILTKDGELEYKYGFFFIEPDTTESAAEGKLFYISIRFPYLSFDEVKAKIEGKYGEPTSENLKNNQGAIAWDSEKTILIMWVDRYENKPFCPKLIYVSKEIAKQLNEYQIKVFNKTEIELIKKLNP